VELAAKVVVVGEGDDSGLEGGDGEPVDFGLGGSSSSSSRVKIRRESALSLPTRFLRFITLDATHHNVNT
jgi:hypothetical protein